MEFENTYIVYVKSNSNGYIIDVKSSEFLSDVTGWTEIERGRGYRYHHAQNNYFEKPIVTDGSAYRYRLVSGQDKKWRECTPEEIAAQEEANRPVPVEPEGSVWDELDTAYQEGVDSV